jgi:iron complex outermembrane receptor protein
MARRTAIALLLVVISPHLLDHAYYEHLSYYRDPFSSGVKVPEPGRNFFVQVKYAF